MRLGKLLPRAVLVVLVWVLATAAFTFAADQKNLIGHGYPSNRVLAQTPAAGTHVVDTGAPTIVVRLVKGQYTQQGTPEDTSSYTGTRIEFPHAPIVKPKAPVVAPKPKAAPKPAAKPKAAPKPKVTKPAKKVAPLKRPPAFTVPGGRKEPQNEISLPARADRLAAWIATNPKQTHANVGRWLYQHSWIVDGAQFGWWHGSQALQKLIAVDQHVERIWGIGHRSEAVARAALVQVSRRSQ